MTETPEIVGEHWLENVPPVESTYNPHRREWNLLVRRPFYMNLRLGGTQNALWLGKRTWFNWFPTPWGEYSTTFGHISRSTVFAELRRLNQKD